MSETLTVEQANQAYRVAVTMHNLPPDSHSGTGKQVQIVVTDQAMNFDVAHGSYHYHARRAGDEGSIVSDWLLDPAVEVGEDTITIRGFLAGLEVEQRLWLPQDRAILEERISLSNPSEQEIALTDFACGMQRRIADAVGRVLPEGAADRFVAIPFRHRPSDPPDWNNDFSVAHLLSHSGRELHVAAVAPLPSSHGFVPSNRYLSEGWAWTHGGHTLSMFKFNQEQMEFSVLAITSGLTPHSTNQDEAGVFLRFAGAGLNGGEFAGRPTLQPGERLDFGVTRFETVAGGHERASYRFRAFLDEQGCRFPVDFNPPVHWNEIYDNPEYILGTPGRPTKPRMTRPVTYTKELMMAEAVKARDYSCEALYLDPGWDSDFATFLWGEPWLGGRKQFVEEVRSRYGLGVALHCPLASWMSYDGRGMSTWPEESYRMDRHGNRIYHESWQCGPVGSVCLGSRQYLNEAEKRLLANCEDGVVFLMFDGNWWSGPCWNPDHGHPIPYTKEDHCRANLDLAQRIHAKFPHVQIEMHDMLTGGVAMRATPVYYKYGLPGSYDTNWGFELMWQPMEDIRSRRALALYDYNLACNVPIYLHIDLRGDNEHALVLWWYASTCRHLGIGGTHENPVIAAAHRHAMQRYRRWERFFKAGEFHGIHEEAHIHALPDENAFIVNLFNLGDESRIVEGTILVEEMGLELDRWYVTPYSHTEGGFNPDSGTFTIRRRMAPWSAQIFEVRALES